jgi:hypothetical protein
MLNVDVVCPYCQKSLMDEEHLIKDQPSIKLHGKLPPEGGSIEGIIRLSAYYGDYQVETTLVIPNESIVQFSCPFCRKHLTSTRICEACNASMVALQFPRGGKVQFCARRGCKKHLIEFEDPEEAIMEFNRNFSPYNE